MRIKRKLKKEYAIIGEGKTETNYFEKVIEYKNVGNDIHLIKNDLKGKVNIKDIEKKIKEYRGNYKEIFIVIDIDGNSEEIDKKRKIIQQIGKNEYVTIIETKPCIELWFLLHFIYTTHCFCECNSVENELFKHIKDYKKSEIPDSLIKNINIAINNSKKLHKEFEDGNSSIYTKIYKLIAEIDDILKKI